MAIRFDANGDYLTRTTSLPGASYPLTVSMWIWFAAAPTDEGFFTIGAGTWFYAYANSSSEWGLDTPGMSAANGSIAATTWYWVTLVVNDANSSVALSVDGSVVVSGSPGTSFTPTDLQIGEPGASFMNGRHAHFKMWTAGLTAAELAQERYSARPRRSANLHLWSPLFKNTKDYSGNARDWTENGTLAYEDGPPVGWGAAPLIVGGSSGAPAGPDYGTPYDHDGVKPFSSLWRAGRM